MERPIFQGACTALITPFDADGIHYPLFDLLLDRQIQAGISAVVVCGTTGEASTMSDAEQLSLIQQTVRHAGGRCRVIAGAGSNDTRHALKKSLAAEQAGADALLIVTPYYNRCSDKGLLLHYETIADAVHIPIIVYNVPSRTGVNITVAEYAALAQMPNICGVKEAGGAVSQISRIRAVCGEDFSVWTGNDDQIVSSMALGAQGVISVLSNLLPQRTQQIATLCLQGNYEQAAALQSDAMDLIDALFCEVNPIPVKQALQLLGYPVGIGRPPLCALSESGKIQLLKAMVRHKLL